jgi:hypothetical protein
VPAGSAGEGRWCLPSGAKLTRLLERQPWLGTLLVLLGMLMVACCIYALWVWLTVEGAGGEWGLVALGLLVAGIIEVSVGDLLVRHQAERQLRRPPLLGDWATRQIDGLANLLIVLGLIVLPACLWYAMGWQLALLGGLPAGFVVVFGVVLLPLSEAQEAAAARASLRVRAGWLRLRLGDAEGAVTRLGEAHRQLQDAVGADNALVSWVVAAPYARALCEAGRGEEAAALRDSVGRTRETPFFTPRQQQRQRQRGASATMSAPEWHLLRAGVAAAARAPDAEVLGLLEASAEAQGWVPAGSRPVGIADTEGGLPEWDEFLARMAQGGDGEDWRRWAAYRVATFELARARVAEMDTLLNSALESRGLPKEIAEGEDDEAKRARLLASLLEHSAYQYES